MTVRFIPIPAEPARFYRHGGQDAYGLVPERAEASTGEGTPCRHCLRQVPAGAAYLILAYRPFTGLNPYTETGPIFVCADDCVRRGDGFPKEFLSSAQYLVRGYSENERIIYGTGHIIPTEEIERHCAILFDQELVDFIHIRSASNNCFQCRVERI